MRDAIALLGLLDLPNVQGWLRLVRAGESSQDDSAYRWLFGSTRKNPKLFDSYADHPRVRTYEAYDGQFIKNGKIDYTTAAGAYQITETTWGAVSKRLGLEDFSPKSQDIAALALTEGRGALEDVLAGRIERAMFLCRKEWASLPHSDYGQPTQSMTHALAVFRKYAVAQPQADAAAPLVAAAAPAPDPAIHRFSPDTVAALNLPTPTAAPSKESTMSILGTAAAIVAPDLLRGLANTLINVFSPLAREKLTKEMERHTESPAVAEQVTTGIIEAAKALTGKDDPIEAVVEARADPAIVQQIELGALDTLERLAPVLDKLHQWDKEARAADDAATATARQFNSEEPLLLDTRWLKLKFIHALSIAFVSFSGWFVTTNWNGMTAELKGAVITLMVIAGWNGVRDYWMGSSRSSAAKDVVIGELSRRPEVKQ